MAKFNPSFDPPAPTARIAIRNIETGERLREYRDDSRYRVGHNALASIKRRKSWVLAFGNTKYYLTGFDGSTIAAETFKLQAIFLGKRFVGNYCVIDDAIGILGRDILNEFTLIYDGPNLEWEEITTANNKDSIA